MKRILVVPPNDLLRHPIPNRVFHVARQLSKWYEIVLLSYPNHPLAEGNVKRTLKADEITYKALRVDDLGLYYIVNGLNLYAVLKNILRDVDVVIHANIIPSFILSHIKGPKKIYDYVDHYPESASAYYLGLRRRLSYTITNFVVLNALKCSDVVVTPSYGLASYLRHFVNKPILIIPNGVDPELFKPIDMSLARKEIGIYYDGTIVLLYGSIDAWLEIKPVLYAIKRNRDVKLLIVGFSHGKYYYRLLESLVKKLGIESSVYRYPPQQYEKIPLFINASNIVLAPFVHTLKNYAVPLKIIESLACARPVITSDIPEFKLWFRKGLFYYKSPQDIYRLLNNLTKDFNNIQYQLLDYSKDIRGRYSWEGIAESYRKVIDGECCDINSDRARSER